MISLVRNNDGKKLGKHGNAIENCLMNRFAARLLQMAFVAIIVVIESLARHPTSPIMDHSGPSQCESEPNQVTEQVQCH